LNTTLSPPEQARAALATLAQHDVVTEQDGRCVYTVELMRRWVARRQVAAEQAG
jgi:hypothetical protein